ncbi:MAG: hypothetical protein ABEH64_00170 [Salinirussus sp.]
MDGRRAAPLVGIAGCLALVVALAYPYLILGEAASTYYSAGSINPLVAGLLALVAIVVFASGREGRTDPGFAAGVGVVFGITILAIVLFWAVTVRVDIIAIDPNHRWVMTVAAAVVPLGAGWFARSLGFP